MPGSRTIWSRTVFGIDRFGRKQRETAAESGRSSDRREYKSGRGESVLYSCGKALFICNASARVSAGIDRRADIDFGGGRRDDRADETMAWKRSTDCKGYAEYACPGRRSHDRALL